MQNDGELARDRDAGLAQASALRDAHAPSFKRRPFGDPGQQHIGCFIQIASHHRVATFGDAPRPIGFA